MKISKTAGMLTFYHAEVKHTCTIQYHMCDEIDLGRFTRALRCDSSVFPFTFRSA